MIESTDSVMIKPWHVIVVLATLAMAAFGTLAVDNRSLRAEVTDLRSCKVEKTDMNRLEDRLALELRMLGAKIDELGGRIGSSNGKRPPP